MKTIRWMAIVVILLVNLTSSEVNAQQASTPNTQTQAQALLNSMTPEEKVGQLFLITFKGTDVSQESQIYDLVVNYHIGGVVLTEANDNFTAEGTVPNAYQLIGQLQTDELAASQSQQKDPTTGSTFTPPYIPLFVGLNQGGDGWPNDQILSGLTNLPNEMAIGATWNPQFANQIGNVLGSELEALGVNLYLGPSLDVLAINPTTGSNPLGTTTFGGDPFWVGEMGQAYISGIHEGSSNRIAVISTHFPGSGSADRSPEEEVATVRESLEQLKQIDLAPFFSVTGEASSTSEQTDGLLVSNIRYQGFQGNIRDTTKPVSSDPTALSQLMTLEQFATWRENGGLLVSDDLGSRAVRIFYDPTGKTYNAHNVALYAFLAGNDLLYADNFVANGDADSYTSIISTLYFFAQKYVQDSSFQQRVDASVLRILNLKLRLYPNFQFGAVVPPADGINSVNQSQQVTFSVAKDAVTLISPGSTELTTLLPKPPQPTDHMIFFTQVMTGQQCSQCAQRQIFPVDGLQSAILKLYGLQGGGEVYPANLVSYSFTDLMAFLNSDKAAPNNLESDLNNADWVIFSLLNVDSSQPDSLALTNMLSERPDLLRDKKVIVFAFNAPYFLDTTDISKLTAYYGLYSKGPYFLDVAARILFQELPPNGSLPVSVPGISYDVIEATSPDPDQTIPLFLETPDKPLPTLQATITPNPTAVSGYKIGDTVNLVTGIIYDHNHNVVPDDTDVQFNILINGDNSSSQQIKVGTTQGFASLTYHIDKSGLIQFSVTSDPAVQSIVVSVNVPGGLTPGVTVVAPTQEASNTPTATLVPTFTITPTLPVLPLRTGKPDFGEWFLVMVLLSAVGGLSFTFGLKILKSLQWGVRSGLCVLLGGLLSYLYLSVGLPGGTDWVQKSSTGGIIGITFIGLLLGWIGSLTWWMILRQTTKRKLTTGS
jgi:beta-N-acetylhexosaminidase